MAEAEAEVKKNLPFWARGVQSVLYAPGPFFVYPHKPIMNAIAGCDYEHAFTNFRRDHTRRANLALHVLALYLQIFCNFALLWCLDELLPAKQWGLPRGTLSIVSGLAWVVVLLLSPAPVPVKVLSVASIAAAGYVGPWLASSHIWVWLPLFNVVVEYFVITTFIRKKTPTIVSAVIFYAVRLPLHFLLHRTFFGVFSKQAKQIALGTGAVMFLMSARDDVTAQKASAQGKRRLSPFMFGLVGWALAALTRQPALYFWGNAFLASLLQGVAHAFSKEAGTLVHLQTDPGNTIAHELAHTVFFPNLLLHTIYARLFRSHAKAA